MPPTDPTRCSNATSGGDGPNYPCEMCPYCNGTGQIVPVSGRLSVDMGTVTGRLLSDVPPHEGDEPTIVEDARHATD